MISDRQMGLLALCAVVGAWWGHSGVAVAIVAATALLGPRRSRRRWGHVVALAAMLAVVAGARSEAAWRAAVPRHLGGYSGWATLVTDPQPLGRGVSVVVEVEGERFQVQAYGSPRRRLSARQAGDRVEITGTRRLHDGTWARRAQVRHVVGEIDVDRVGAHDPGTPLARAGNRLRGWLRASATATMGDEQASLFTGLVVGDDGRQPAAMIDQFRRSGLSHLTAVSGQNVAYILAMLGFALRALPRWWRWGATLAVIAWFVVLTRVEPSVVRAGAMAALSATGFALGRERGPTRLLFVAVVLLVLADPLLVWSVGFWLSTGATFGVTAVAPVLAARLRGPSWVVAPLAVTLGAQVGVVVPSWLVFGRLPAMGVAANLLAVPVAGFVMLYGIPAGLAAAAVPALGGLVLWPAAAGTRWVATVAALAARLEPTGVAAAAVWAAQLALVAGLWRWRHPPGGVER